MNTTSISLLVTTFLTAIMAGFFYAFSVCVVLGLGKLANGPYLESFQLINRAVLNPVFFITFFGTIPMLLITSYLYYKSGINQQFWLVILATVIYIIGSAGVTFLGNIPLNETLDAINLATLDGGDQEKVRLAFEKPWNTFNLTRTIASTISFILLLLACFKN